MYNVTCLNEDSTNGHFCVIYYMYLSMYIIPLITYLYIYNVTGEKIGLRKRWRGLDASVVFGVLVWMLADVQTNGSSSNVHVQWFSCWKIRADDHDSMKWCHKDLSCYSGGNYKRRAQPNLRAVVWVFWYQVFGFINKPQTLYFGCLGASCGEEHNQNGMCDLFIHMHVPRLFWGTLS